MPERTTRWSRSPRPIPRFNPVELTVNLQKGISLENTGVVDATAGQNIYLDSGQDVANQGALLPITLDLVTAERRRLERPPGRRGAHPRPGRRRERPAGRRASTSSAAISSWKEAIPAGSARACSRSSSTWPPTALLEEANAELSVYLSEVNGDLDLVTASSVTGEST